MISVGSRDARKGLELGFGDIGMGGGWRDTGDTELEEGEACSNQNEEDYDSSIDPDVALSYIDAKIQDVLGHFQKDFETDVSFETLGRKFGGYGSFLSSNQRSPPWSQPKTPPKVQSYNIQRSPNNIEPECGRGNPSVSSAVHQTVQLGSSCTRTMGQSTTNAPLNNSNREVCIPNPHLDTFISNKGLGSKKTTSTSDQKCLKFRIKMGQENLSTQKNAAIYTGLGLDVSPSSSNDESQFESEGISHEPEDGSSESPTSILQIMTSLPVLLSPLCDNLIHLAGKGTYARDVIVPTSGGCLETSDMSVHASDFVKGDRKVVEGKKMKSKPRADFSVEFNGVEFNGGSKKRFKNDNGVITKKEMETNTLNCEEIVSKTIKLPFISNLDADTDDSSKDNDRPHDNLKEASQRIVREKAVSDRITMTHAACADDDEFIEKAKAVSDGKVVQMNNRSAEDHSVDKVKENHRKRERSYGSMIDCKGRKVPFIESTALTGKNNRKVAYGQESTGLPIDKENLYSGKEKSKESPFHDGLAPEVQKETMKLASSLLPKVNKKSDEGSNSSENDTAEVRVQNHQGKSGDRYRAVNGDLEEQKYRKGLSCSLDENKPKDRDIVVRSRLADDCPKKLQNSNKKQKRQSSSDRYLKTAAAVSHCPSNGPVKDADPGGEVLVTGATVVAEDNWVQCDRCLKWRLLPIGKNPDDLPDKWLCSMQDWLPGLNSCSINEEETKKAVISLYQVPLPESQSNHPAVGISIVTGGAISTIKNHGRHAKDNKLQAIPGGNKKLRGEVSNGASKDGAGHFTTTKKNLQPSIRHGSSNDVNRSSLDTVSVVQKLIISSDITGEKHKNVHESTDDLPDQGEARMKLKRRLDPDQNDFGSKKKNKIEKMKTSSENLISDYNGPSLKVHQNSSNNFQIASPSKSQLKKEEWPFSKDSIDNTKERRQVTFKKQRYLSEGSLNEGSLDMVSASHRTKASFQEVKGSPGESVSSSPMQNSNLDKAKHMLGKCEAEDRPGSSKYCYGLHFRKSEKGSSSMLKDKNWNFKPESNADKVRSSEQLRDQSPSYEAKHNDSRARSQDILDVKSDQVPRRGKSGKIENEALPSCSRPVSSSRKFNGDMGNTDIKVEESKLQKKQIRMVDHPNGNQQINYRHLASNEHGTKELDAPFPSRRDSSTHSANNALKEATDLKHLADRHKNAGSSESTGLYFQAALKFLHGASLLESCNNGSAKHNELAQSKQVYGSTAKLCGFCAHEYEKAKDMETAALAYKCMEVAYMRVIYSSHASASRDRHELQTALPVVHLGESPSSSASDIDNVHNSVMAEKLALPKGISSPQVSGAQFVAARNCSSVMRLLNFTQDVNFAMEASRKSQNALATVKAISSATKNAEGIPSIEEALNFSFQDVEGLLRLVRLAMEAINH